MTLHHIRQLQKLMTLFHLQSRMRHPTDSSSLPTPEDTPQNRIPKSHYKLRQQPRKDYRLFLSPSKILNH